MTRRATIDRSRTPRYRTNAADAQRVADNLTPVDMSGHASTAETVERRIEAATVAKMKAVSGAFAPPQPNVARALEENRRRMADGSFMGAYMAWRHAQATKAAVEADALRKGRRRYAKRLLKGSPDATGAGFRRYRELGGRMSEAEWRTVR